MSGIQSAVFEAIKAQQWFEKTKGKFNFSLSQFKEDIDLAATRCLEQWPASSDEQMKRTVISVVKYMCDHEESVERAMLYAK